MVVPRAVGTGVMVSATSPLRRWGAPIAPRILLRLDDHAGPPRSPPSLPGLSYRSRLGSSG